MRAPSRHSFAALLLTALVAAGCGGRQQAERERLEFVNIDKGVAYLGKDACRQCHLEKYTTAVKTGMGRALYPMTQAEELEDFTHNNEFVDERAGLTYRMLKRDGRYYQQQFVVDSRGGERALVEYELIWVIGSNNHSRSYVIEVDGKLFQAPICWYPLPEIWDLCPGYEVKNDHFQRELGLDCLHCHNGKMFPLEGERNAYERPFPHGIGCERCHGPGELHAERWRAESETPRGEPDPTIVNPRRLPREERMEVCFQCHLADAKATENVQRDGTGILDFRPGMKFTETTIPFRYKEPTVYDYGLSAQADRLLLSRCYEESGGKIECLTCHNPHITIYHEDRPADYFRLKCLSCHATGDCSEDEATRQATATPDNCIACHMRKDKPDDAPHHVMTDHWIRRDIDVRERDPRDSYEIEPYFPDRLAELPPGEAAYYEARAGYLLARDVPESRRPEMWAAAVDNFRKAIDRGFDNANSWFFLGKTLLLMGKGNEARAAFEKAVERDGAHHDANFALGQALVAAGYGARALELFEAMLLRDPGDPMALAEVGRVYTAMGRVPDAIAAYEQAIEHEPWTASLRLNLGMLLASQSRFDEAAAQGEEAARLDPDTPEVWEFYARVMQAAGRVEDSAEGRFVLQRLQQMKRGGS